MKKDIPLTDAKTNLPRIIKEIERLEEEVVVTRNGRPVAVILNYDEFRRLRETVDVLTDRLLMNQIRKSQAHYKKRKKGLSESEVFGDV